MEKVIVDSQAKKKLQNGFLWIYQSQIISWSSVPSPGDLVIIEDETNQCLGYAYANTLSVISLRVLYTSTIGKKYKNQIDECYEIKRKLDRAWSKRQGLKLDSNAYRLVWSEADGLPGLIIDVYDQVVVIQYLTQGMEVRKNIVLDWIKSKLKPQGVFERSDQLVRQQEGLERKSGWLWKNEDYSGNTKPVIHEGEARYLVDIQNGHKTGFYLDQRASRRVLRTMPGLGSVLDCFSNTGGFTIAALAGKAKKVTAIDQSEDALNLLKENALLNNMQDCIQEMNADVFKTLSDLTQQGMKYDTVILDPPPFAKHKKQVQDALKGYFELHRMVAKLLAPKGLLITCNCSHYINARQFRAIVVAGLKQGKRKVEIKKQFGPDADHPGKSQLPESSYLTTIIVKVS